MSPAIMMNSSASENSKLNLVSDGLPLSLTSGSLQSTSNGCKWSVRVNKATEAAVPRNEIIGQLKQFCLFLDSLQLPKYEKCISNDVFASTKKATESFLGFGLERRPSLIPGAGLGVFVSRGKVEKCKLVAIYPGTVYRPGEPVFIQSVANAYLFRCADGLLIDGNDRGLSRLLYSSCSYRDRAGPWLTSDMTWLTSLPINPLAVGQYVNNHTPDRQANVAYEEIDLPLSDFPPNLRRFIPEVSYSSLNEATLNKRMTDSSSLLMADSDPKSTNAGSDVSVERHRYPHAIVWTPIPLITWIFPFVGHCGICTSSGIIRDFAGSYYVSEDCMGFGWPTKYWQLSLNKVSGGTSSWDNAVVNASEEYKKRVHNLFCDNCHSHVALALNSMNYDNKSSWNMVSLATIMFFKGKYTGIGGFLKQWLPFAVLLIIVGLAAGFGSSAGRS